MPALCVLALSLIAGGCNRGGGEAEVLLPKVDGSRIIFPDGSEETNSLVIEPAQPGQGGLVHLTGRLVWNENSTVRVFSPVAGRVRSVQTDVGQTVSVGARLAEIDSPDFGQALADARTADGNLRMADRALTRVRELFVHGAIAQKDVENAEASYVSATAEKLRAAARLTLYGGTSSSTNELFVLRSPLGGVLVERNLNPGQEVRADQMLANATSLYAPLFVVSDPTQLWLELDVPESSLAALRRGQKLQIHARAYPDRIFDGQIDNIGAALDPATRNARVRGRVNNADLLLKAEMYVGVDVIVDPSEPGETQIEISSKSVFLRGDQYYLFVRESPGRYLRRPVRIGVEEGGKVRVLEGLQAGQRVVTDGSLLLESLFEAANPS